MSNISEAEENPFAGEESEPNHTLGKVMMYWNLITFIYDFFLCLVNISAGIFLMVIILRHSKLRTRTNMYIFHFALNNVLYYLGSFLIHLIFELARFYRRNLFCSVDNFDAVFLSLTLIFGVLLAVDWYIVNIKPLLLDKYVKYEKHIILIVYLMGLVKFLIGLTICFVHNLYYLFPYSMYFIYLLCLVIINVINYLRYKHDKIGDPNYHNTSQITKYRLLVANVIIHSWFLLVLYTFSEMHLYMTAFYQNFLMYVMNFTSIIVYSLANGNLIVVTYLLGRYNTDFQMAYKMAFKRRFRKYNHNDLGQSDEDSSVHHIADTDFVEVKC